jgi:hypothetical protein
LPVDQLTLHWVLPFLAVVIEWTNPDTKVDEDRANHKSLAFEMIINIK